MFKTSLYNALFAYRLISAATNGVRNVMTMLMKRPKSRPVARDVARRNSGQTEWTRIVEFSLLEDDGAVFGVRFVSEIDSAPTLPQSCRLRTLHEVTARSGLGVNYSRTFLQDGGDTSAETPGTFRWKPLSCGGAFPFSEGLSRLRTLAATDMKGDLRACVEQFLSTLDPDAVEAFLRYDNGVGSRVKTDGEIWLTTTSSPVLDTRCLDACYEALDRRYRRQNIVERLLSPSTTGGLDLSCANARFDDVLIRAITASTTIPWALLEGFPFRFQVPVAPVAAFLSTLPREWMPTTVDDWTCAFHVSRAFIEAISRFGVSDDIAGFVNLKRGWRDLATRLEAAASAPTWDNRHLRATLDGGDGDGLYDAVVNCDDMVDLLVSTVVGPALVLTDAKDATMFARKVAIAAVFGTKSLAGILRASQDWHARSADMGVAISSIAVDTGDPDWPAALPDMDSPNGTVRILVTRAQLVSEGQAMRHCVGTYWPECVRGWSRIASLTTASGLSTTAEISLDEGKPSFRIAQHHGQGNSRPLAESERLLCEYVDMLNAMPEDATMEVAALFEGCGTVVIDDSGYDFTAPGNWKKALAIWSPFLRRDLRGTTPDVFVGKLQAAAASR